MKCQKCGGEMEEGLMKTPNMSPNEVWGTKVNILGYLENKKEVKTYRCKKCGYLESYAK